MKCDNCGHENTEESKFCNNCGNTLSSQPLQPDMKQEIRPSSTPMIIFSVINILCCGSFILGVIALVFALMSNSETDIQEVQRKLRIAKILNIIGIILGVIKLIIGIIFFIAIIIYGNGEFAGYDYSNYF